MVLLLSMFAVCFGNRNVVKKKIINRSCQTSLSVGMIHEICVSKIHCTGKMDDQEDTVQKNHISTNQMSAFLIWNRRSLLKYWTAKGSLNSNFFGHPAYPINLQSFKCCWKHRALYFRYDFTAKLANWKLINIKESNSTLKTEAVGFPEISIPIYQSTWCWIPEDWNLN